MTDPSERGMERAFDSALVVPEAFHAWAKALPERARTCLSIHELRQIWEERAAAVDEAREEGVERADNAYAVLQKIVDWRPPRVRLRIDCGSSYPAGTLVPMCVARGSNGVRDYFRGLAQMALSARSKPSEAPTEGGS